MQLLKVNIRAREKGRIYVSPTPTPKLYIPFILTKIELFIITGQQKRRRKYVLKGVNYIPSPTMLSMAKNNYSFEKPIDKSLKTHKSRRFPFTDTYMN